tara:strand:- start:1194 stop:1961 length:768 start_codon:yes stop_codon:yes gene_type:complete
MESIQTKIRLKKKKKIMNIINHVFSIDETTINFSGDKNDTYSKVIENSFTSAISGNSNLSDEIKTMKGLSGRKFRVMMNNLIKIFNNPKYLEIGSWLGSSACSVCCNNKVNITCIDDWSQNFSTDLDSKKIFKKNLKKILNENISLQIIEKDFRKVNFQNLNDINIYFYDGSHHYQDHYDAIKLVLPSLTKKFILIVDDWNWEQVRKGTLDSIYNEKLKIISKLEIRTTTDNSSSLIVGENSDWHQGVAFLVVKK